MPIRTNQKLWERIVKDVKKGGKGGKKNQWSARKAQLSVKIYKSKGGRYTGRKKVNSLTKWTKEEWGTKSGKNSVIGKEATGERYLPKKAIKALSNKEYSDTSRIKRRSVKQYSRQPLKIAKKVKKYRSIKKSTRKHKKR